MNFSKIKVGDTLSYILKGTNESGEKIALEVHALITSVEPVPYIQVEEKKDEK